MINRVNRDAGEPFDCRAYLAKHGGITVTRYNGEIVYAQGDPADAVYCIVAGSVKITVLSEQGKEGVIAMLGAGDFFGEGSLGDRTHRTSTITTTSDSEIVRLSRGAVRRALADDAAFSKLFFYWILLRNEKLKADLIDQLFNSSERRLARILLMLATIGSNQESNVIAMPITQETLANMVGTTRARINQFMRRFSELGYVDYDGTIRVHQSLQNIFLEEPHNHTCGGT